MGRRGVRPEEVSSKHGLVSKYLDVLHSTFLSDLWSRYPFPQKTSIKLEMGTIQTSLRFHTTEGTEPITSAKTKMQISLFKENKPFCICLLVPSLILFAEVFCVCVWDKLVFTKINSSLKGWTLTVDWLRYHSKNVSWPSASSVCFPDALQDPFRLCGLVSLRYIML